MKNKQTQDQVRKLKRDPRLILLILIIMFLVISQVIVLLANSGFVNQPAEPVSVNEQPITLDDLKAVNADLNEVRKSLNEIKANSDLKDDPVEVKKVESKPVVVPPAPVVVKKEKENIKPKKKITENKKIAVIEKSPTIVIPVPASINEDIIPSVEKPVAEVNTVTDIKPAYIKHDANGSLVEDSNEQWTCVHDTSTGMMWEVKSEDDAMRHSNNLYSWYNPEHTTLKGKPDGGRCKGDTDCDTNAYVQAMNKRNYCGHNDWSLPTREQMQTLVNLENANHKVKIDKQYFPETMPSWYWTSSEHNNKDDFAWYVLFRNGHALSDLKERPKHIRLVRVTNTKVSSN